MRRKLPILLLAFDAGLATSGVAVAANGGFASEVGDSPNASRANEAIAFSTVSIAFFATLVWTHRLFTVGTPA